MEVGAGVQNLKVGDRVCMEPGVPDPNSRAARLGMYNIDPAVTFWARSDTYFGSVLGSAVYGVSMSIGAVSELIIE